MGGLDHTIAFDQASGTLIFRANPRPSESTLHYVVVRDGNQEAYQASIHFVRICSGRKRGRRLDECECAELTKKQRIQAERILMIFMDHITQKPALKLKSRKIVILTAIMNLLPA